MRKALRLRLRLKGLCHQSLSWEEEEGRLKQGQKWSVSGQWRRQACCQLEGGQGIEARWSARGCGVKEGRSSSIRPTLGSAEQWIKALVCGGIVLGVGRMPQAGWKSCWKMCDRGTGKYGVWTAES